MSIRHSLVDVNETTRRAICCVCGPVGIVKNGSWICATKRHQLNKVSRDRRTPERKSEIQAEMKLYYQTNKERLRNNFLIKTYGITAEDYDRMLAEQDGKCAICGSPDPIREYFDVDHDHETGVVRGLLCSPCNVSLGGFQDDPVILQAAIEYLKTYPRH